MANYRAEKAGLEWFFSGPCGPLRLHEYFVQSSHNTFILGQQLKLSMSSVPVDIVYAEACAVALNLGYRMLELDVWRARGAGGLRSRGRRTYGIIAK